MSGQTDVPYVMPAFRVAQRRGFGVFQPSARPPLAKTEAEKKILAVLGQARQTGQVHLAVSAETGRLLRLLTETAGAQRVVEVGTSTGYSGLWFCLALQKTGGKLTTFEIDRERAATARKHFQQAGVEQLVSLIEGDAHENVQRSKDPIDVVFLDADKDGDYLNRLLPLVRPGLILADNVNMAPQYVQAVTTSADLETLFSAGLGITLKKR